MEIVAIAVILVYLVISTWALRARPGSLAAEDLIHVWRFSPWGKQLMIDFYCLEVVVGLWMVSHAMANDTLLLAVICLVSMPILGALTRRSISSSQADRRPRTSVLRSARPAFGRW